MLPTTVAILDYTLDRHRHLVNPDFYHNYAGSLHCLRHNNDCLCLQISIHLSVPRFVRYVDLVSF